MRILTIQDCAIETFGLYERYLTTHGHEVLVVHAYKDHTLPPLETVDAILVGGTPISVRDVESHSFLKAEYDYLRRAVDADVPCLGICFGGQILARVLGAEVRRCAQMEIGVYEARLTSEGRDDPLLAGFPERFPVFQWHGDTFDVPRDARLLVEGEVCRNQMFRLGNVVGVQFHLEVAADEVASWADEYSAELELVNKTKSQVLAECTEHQAGLEQLGARFLDNFVAIAARRRVSG